MNKNYRSAHFVGHSKLKELDIDGFYKIKKMNEKMGAEKTKMDLTPDHLAESKDEGTDEDIPIHIRKERMKKAYKQKIIQDIETIDTYENRKKLV